MKTVIYFIRNFLTFVLFFFADDCFSQNGTKWSTGGNAVGNNSILGTTNNQPLVFYTNNQEAMRLDPNGTVRYSHFSGSGRLLLWADNNGVMNGTPFSNDSAEVLTGDGTFKSIASMAGWKFSGNNIYNSNFGFVGIGTNTPQYLLDVNGNMRVNGTVYTTGLQVVQRIQADTIKGSVIVEVDNKVCLLGGVNSGLCTKTGDLLLQSKPGFDGNTLLNAGTNGNVGIGITSPLYKLDVSGDQRISGILYLRTIRPLPGDTEVVIGENSIHVTSGNRIFPTLSTFNSMTYHGMGIGSYSASGYGLFSVAMGNKIAVDPAAIYSIAIGSGVIGGAGVLTNSIPNSIMLGTNSTLPTLFIGPASGAGMVGRVGIGTTSPQADFQVGDGWTKLAIGTAPNVAVTYSSAYIGFNAARTAGGWQTEGNGFLNGGVVLLNDMSGGLRIIGLPASGAGAQTFTDAQVQDNTRLFIRHDGRVCIGSNTMMGGPHDSPATRLTVDGTVICRELFVTQHDWADSIFYPDYYLMPLDSLGKFVQSNGHLPGVPTAGEVAVNGSSLGQNDVILLAKIEELTLYLLQLQQQNAVLQQQIDELKAK